MLQELTNCCHSSTQAISLTYAHKICKFRQILLASRWRRCWMTRDALFPRSAEAQVLCPKLSSWFEPTKWSHISCIQEWVSGCVFAHGSCLSALLHVVVLARKSFGSWNFYSGVRVHACLRTPVKGPHASIGHMDRPWERYFRKSTFKSTMERWDTFLPRNISSSSSIFFIFIFYIQIYTSGALSRCSYGDDTEACLSLLIRCGFDSKAIRCAFETNLESTPGCPWCSSYKLAKVSCALTWL